MEFTQVWLCGDVTHSAAHGACAKLRCLVGP
jgi:hypothetical protein